MTPEETRQAAAVMLAHAEGKKIEYRIRDEEKAEWVHLSCPSWSWDESEYRVAPERWCGKIWVHPDGRIERPFEGKGHRWFVDNGWRLIEAKEVEP